jgi:hypothetical protein
MQNAAEVSFRHSAFSLWQPAIMKKREIIVDLVTLLGYNSRA